MTRFGLCFNLLNDPPESRSIAARPEFRQNVGLLLVAPVQLGQRVEFSVLGGKLD